MGVECSGGFFYGAFDSMIAVRMLRGCPQILQFYRNGLPNLVLIRGTSLPCSWRDRRVCHCLIGQKWADCRDSCMLLVVQLTLSVDSLYAHTHTQNDED